MRYEKFRTKRRESKTKDEKKAKDPAARRRHLAEYRAWLSPYRGSLLVVLALALVGMALETALPLATRRIIDDILLAAPADAAAARSHLHLISGGVLGLLLLAQGVEALRAYRMTVLNAKVVFDLRKRLFGRLVKLPLGQLADMKTGGVVSRLSSDVDNVTGLVQMAVISPGVAATKVVVTLGILLWMNWQMTLVAAALLPWITWISLLWVRRGRPIYRSMSDDRAGVDGRVAETFGGIRVVRSFRREAKEQHDYALGHHTMIRKNILANLIEIVVNGGWSLMIPLVSLLVVWYGGTLVLAGSATVGDIVAFQLYSGMLLFPIWRIVLSISQTQRALASMEKVFEVLATPGEMPDAATARNAPERVESLVFEHVSFAYKEDTEVLKDLHFTVPGGSTVALVGPSGAGKTTLTDLVARFQDPTKGRILLNGRDLRELRLETYRRLIGVVQQEVFLFDGTVRDNIAYGNRDASLAEVQEAARRANADEFVRGLPGGYDALIGERGVKLSGGQRQRLSIARAILADPQILILDEATSNLDTESEQLIQRALIELFRDRTTFVIAHRLSTITHADMIVVVEKGLIRELGTHAELMERRGLYHEMVERQRQAFTI